MCGGLFLFFVFLFVWGLFECLLLLDGDGVQPGPGLVGADSEFGQNLRGLDVALLLVVQVADRRKALLQNVALGLLDLDALHKSGENVHDAVRVPLAALADGLLALLQQSLLQLRPPLALLRLDVGPKPVQQPPVHPVVVGKAHGPIVPGADVVVEAAVLRVHGPEHLELGERVLALGDLHGQEELGAPHGLLDDLPCVDVLRRGRNRSERVGRMRPRRRRLPASHVELLPLALLLDEDLEGADYLEFDGRPNGFVGRGRV